MIEHAFNVVSAGSVFFAVSIGLLVVLSIMRVVNLAHGAFLTIGGYAAVVVSDSRAISIVAPPALSQGLATIPPPTQWRSRRHQLVLPLPRGFCWADRQDSRLWPETDGGCGEARLR